MEITPAHTLSFTGVISESRRIIKSNYSHFLILSLFFLPLSISLIITPALRFSGNQPPPPPPTHHQQSFPPDIHHLVYILSIYILTLCATSSITHKSHHIFTTNNTNHPTTLTTLTNSLIPLAFTAVASHALIFLASLVLLMLVGVLFVFAQTLALSFGLRFVIDYDSVYFTAFSVIVSVVLFVVMVYFYVNLLLVNVVVVTEAKWGFSALVRSWYLVQGMRSVAVKLVLFYGVSEGVLVLVYSRSVIGYGLGSWAFCLNMMFGSGFLMLFLLQNCVANVVLYNYCKAVHGELVIDVGEGFVCDYVGLGADDEKAPLVVTVVTA